jgi:hypothetical protein
MTNTVEQAMVDAFGRGPVEAARNLNPSLDVWSKEAHDMLKIAALANFDVKAIVLACVRAKRGEGKINVASVLREMDKQEAEWAKLERREIKL